MKTTIVLKRLTSAALLLFTLNPPISPVLAQPILFTNPTSNKFVGFGNSMTGVGNDGVLIGANTENTGTMAAGAAYLFNIHGILITTFTNPTPISYEGFGNSLAAVSNDLVVIGASMSPPGGNTGRAYLFNTNGTFLTTFVSPRPAYGDQFGWSMAGVGNDRVLIGAPFDDTGARDAGAAYLFLTNGTRLATFTSPTAVTYDQFGLSVAALGNDRVLIGAPFNDTGASDTGAAYLFLTNGTLLNTFTNPTPASYDQFGRSVAAVGNDGVLIGAPFNDTGASDAGAAFFFSTNGTLLTTFTNPVPASGDEFGRSVAAVGNDRVLISAPFSDTGTADAGVAYLFSTNGTLLITFTNPSPATCDWFGALITAVGSDWVLIGKGLGNEGDDVAYLFSTEIPSLRITSVVKTGSNLQISFLSQPCCTYNVLGTSNLLSRSWSTLQSGLAGNGGPVQANIPWTAEQAQQFFRIQEVP